MLADSFASFVESYSRMTEERENLYSKLINNQGKVIFLDVRSNQRGVFLKITERNHRQRRTVILSKSAIKTLMSLLKSEIHEPSEVTDKDSVAENEWKTLITKKVSENRKIFYFDIMINSHGKSLNIAEISRRHDKISLIIPQSCWGEMEAGITEILEKFPLLKEEDFTNNTLYSRKLQIPPKRFYFDFLEMEGGKTLKLTEDSKRKRVSIFIPEVCFDPILQLMSNLQAENYVDEVPGMQACDPSSLSENTKVLCSKILELEGNEKGLEGRIYKFEFRENQHGKFLKLNESGSGALFLPDLAFEETSANLKLFMEKFP